MRLVAFCHSLISDWNHGNAHFLRGVFGELQRRGWDVRVFEPRNSWSLSNMLRDSGAAAVAGFRTAYPALSSVGYDPASLDLDEALADADVVIVHEWNEPAIVAAVGRHRASSGKYVLLFHDTHHRSVSDPFAMQQLDLSQYDGVLAFGEVIREHYVTRGWGRRAWTWHEAADVRIFGPIDGVVPDSDVVWIGNWGDGERSAEIRDYLVRPVRNLGLAARVHGVRYPRGARRELADAGIEYRGWLPNYLVPAAFASYRLTLHIPRRPYVENLPGIPTIRVFEALACGIPLVSAYWCDAEGLFSPGLDYLVARTPEEMQRLMRTLISDRDRARELSDHGMRTIHERHTCKHRVDELLQIVASVRAVAAVEAAT